MITIIDIGSNSIRAMDVDAGMFSPKRLITTRLAAGLDATGRLCEQSMARSVAAIGTFAQEARVSHGDVYAYATSAVRDASNQAEFLARVYADCGVSIDVLTGAQEARYALAGARAEGLVDIGGGSAQIVTEGFAQSWPIGCVRARELGSREAIEARCRALFRFPRLCVRDWVGVGGTITTLGALKLGLKEYDRAAIASATLTPEDVEALIASLAAMPNRSAHPLLTQRHDVILPGAMVCACILRGMGIPSLRVSDADGMEGYYLAKLLSQIG